MAGTKRKASSEASEIQGPKTTKRAKKNSASSGASSPVPEPKTKNPVQKKKRTAGGKKKVSFSPVPLPSKLAPLPEEVVDRDDGDWDADFDAEMERYLREGNEAPQSPEPEEEEPAKTVGGCGKGKARVEEEDDLPSLVPAGIDPAMAIAIAGMAWHNDQPHEQDQDSTTENPPKPSAITAFDDLLHRTHLAALARASLRPSSSFPPTATEQKLDGSISVLPRPTNWDNIYCNQCHAWGRNCFYSQQGCVYQRYEKEVVLGGWCEADCGYCLRMKRE